MHLFAQWQQTDFPWYNDNCIHSQVAISSYLLISKTKIPNYRSTHLSPNEVPSGSHLSVNGNRNNFLYLFSYN